MSRSFYKCRLECRGLTYHHVSSLFLPHNRGSPAFNSWGDGEGIGSYQVLLAHIISYSLFLGVLTFVTLESMYIPSPLGWSKIANNTSSWRVILIANYVLNLSCSSSTKQSLPKFRPDLGRNWVIIPRELDIKLCWARTEVGINSVMTWEVAFPQLGPT